MSHSKQAMPRKRIYSLWTSTFNSIHRIGGKKSRKISPLLLCGRVGVSNQGGYVWSVFTSCCFCGKRVLCGMGLADVPHISIGLGLHPQPRRGVRRYPLPETTDEIRKPRVFPLRIWQIFRKKYFPKNKKVNPHVITKIFWFCRWITL